METGNKESLLKTLEARFRKNTQYHQGIEWSSVEKMLLRNEKALKALGEMELTGGEPDVIGYDKASHAIVFCDCAKEAPAGRRSVCYDKEALDSRKENKPKASAVEMAERIGMELLDEGQYRKLQELGEFDLKTSCWVKTPAAIRKLGGALFCDRRYDHVFTYHNGADSYYAVRGFRGILKV